MSSWPARSDGDIFATSAEAQLPVPCAVGVTAGDVLGRDGVVGRGVVGLGVDVPSADRVGVDASGWRGGPDGEAPVEHAATRRVAAVATTIAALGRGRRLVRVSGTGRRYLPDLWR